MLGLEAKEFLLDIMPQPWEASTSNMLHSNGEQNIVTSKGKKQHQQLEIKQRKLSLFLTTDFSTVHLPLS